MSTLPKSALATQKCRAFEHILCATDFSFCSERALIYSSAIARHYGSELLVVHALAPEILQVLSPTALPGAFDQSRRYAEQRMATLVQNEHLKAVHDWSAVLMQGEVCEVLSRLVRKHNLDLIVMGTHGHSGIRKLLLGSTAEKVIRLSACPVLTVGPNLPDSKLELADFHKLLFAVDFSPECEVALPYVLSLATMLAAQLSLLYVIPETEALHQDPRRVLAYLQQRLREMVTDSGKPGCELGVLTEIGPAAEGILKVAGWQESDLIILGVRSGAPSHTHLPGATAYKVACQACCPVMTVRA